MKRKLLLLATLCFVGVIQAQETEGVSMGIPLPDASAILHVQSDTKGVLIPNVILTDLNSKSPIKTNVKESLLVYNKEEKKEDATGKVVIAKGYYYWVSTDAATGAGKWVRVITSEDAGDILDGQMKAEYKAEQREFDFYKIDPVTNKVVIDDKGNPVLEPALTDGYYIYTPDVDNPAKDKLEIEIPEIVKKTQTLTTFRVGTFTQYNYSDGTTSRVRIPEKEPILQGTSEELELIYTDERGVLNKIAVKELLGSDNEDVPAITKLNIDGSWATLTYTNDKGVSNDIDLKTAIQKHETQTQLVLDNKGEGVLTFTNESGLGKEINIRSVVQEPWYNGETGKEAKANTDNIYTQGWVGVGFTATEVAKILEKDGQGEFSNLKTDEKLRVNGSIYARNSYYADYVFENYFTKEASSLKYDYNFKDLSSVESFIKANYHLPGITPVGELEKSNEDGYLINVSELSIQLLEKVEELYLHTIDQQKIIEKQSELLEKQERRLNEIESLLKK